MVAPLNPGDTAPLSDILVLPKGLELMTSATGEILDADATKRHREIILSNAVDYIKAQKEVTLVVYLNGGLALNVELIQKLLADGFPMDKLHLAYADGKPHDILLSSDEIIGSPVYVDDIADSLKSREALVGQLETRGVKAPLATFAPVVKKQTAGLLPPDSVVVEGSVAAMLESGKMLPSVMYAEAIEDSWAVSGYGMNGGHLENHFAEANKMLALAGKAPVTLTEVDEYYVALTDSLERLSSFCMKGKPEGFNKDENSIGLQKSIKEYVNFLYEHSAVHNVQESRLLDTLISLRLEGQRGNNKPIKIGMAGDLINAIKAGRINIGFN